LTSRMLAEAREAPAAVARNSMAGRPRTADFGAFLRARPPQLAADRGARQLRPRRPLHGLPDHGAHGPAGHVAADVADHAVPVADRLRRPGLAGVLAVGPEPRPGRADALLPRRRRLHRGLRQRRRSPLAKAAQWVFPLHAGPETSVAATKSYIAQLVAGARLVAAWQDDLVLQAALSGCPACCRAPRMPTGRRGRRAARRRPAVRDRPRHRPGDRDGSGAEVQGDLRHPGRGLLGRRGQARPDGAGRRRLPAAGVRAARAGAGRAAALADEMRARGAACCSPRRRARRARAAARRDASVETSTRSRRSRASTRWSRRSRARAASTRTSRATWPRSRGRIEPAMSSSAVHPGRLVMVDIQGTSLDAAQAAFLRRHHIRAVCLFRATSAPRPRCASSPPTCAR
jgi:hypothetical protein